MNHPGELQHGIRQKILAGDLPKQNCRMTWYGPGRAGICVACEQPIAADDVEVECDLPEGGTIRLHRRCYDIWGRGVALLRRAMRWQGLEPPKAGKSFPARRGAQ